jgi:hypothetical protein
MLPSSFLSQQGERSPSALDNLIAASWVDTQRCVTPEPEGEPA